MSLESWAAKDPDREAISVAGTAAIATPQIHLVEADVPFKVIGDYIGHRTGVATQDYAKLAVHKLRQLVIGEAEDIL